MIDDDYHSRQKKKYNKKALSTYERYFGRKDGENAENEEKSILETPPLPDYHHNKKLYCPNCTREHLEMHCKERSSRGAPASS